MEAVAIVVRPERKPGVMSTEDLAKLERIARNMPFIGPIMLANAVDPKMGVVYMAYGKDAKGCYMGLWGCRGFGRTLNFHADVGEEKVKESLMQDAADVILGMEECGMLDVGWWNKRG